MKNDSFMIRNPLGICIGIKVLHLVAQLVSYILTQVQSHGI
jgi:hypothetical protein